MSKIIDAVSIVLTCGDKMFTIQRQYFLNAFPGYWAFPGGKVEVGDETYSIEHEKLKEINHRLFGALVREAQEELGIDIREEIKSGSVTKVDYLGLAVTPDFNPYRFATFFFKIEFSSLKEFAVDTNEAKFAGWMSAAQILMMFNEGHLLAVPPVIKVIETLGKDPNTSKIDDINFAYDNAQHIPYIESIKGIKQIMPLSHTLPPATRTNAFLIGDKESGRILIDPSPQNHEEYRKFKNTLSLFGVDKILITHHHPDHYELSNELARELNLPILISQDSCDRIVKKTPNFFDGIHMQFLKEGDVLTKWLGRDVLIMEIPGHDEGQLAPYASDNSWFIAGDLFQGIGTVVIGGEEGDMRKYFSTLERIIKLSPKVVFPSHGIGLGGTFILEKTLKHRKEREAQVLSYYLEGLKPEEMLPKIYAEVKKELWPYALENILKHLEKLKADKMI
jgi:glyoxylase-like metal-dependent hydrolase (beta-lactamase superfamily II)/8-oxo-dGTP pyrophosphatase MutT (NUDIX family)